MTKLFNNCYIEREHYIKIKKCEQQRKSKLTTCGKYAEIDFTEARPLDKHIRQNTEITDYSQDLPLFYDNLSCGKVTDAVLKCGPTLEVNYTVSCNWIKW